MKWETQSAGSGLVGSISRARVVGGWLVTHMAVLKYSGITFVPDPAWSWDWTKDQPSPSVYEFRD